MKAAIVTGAGSGIGRAVANVLHSMDFRVALVGRNPRKLEAVQKELSGKAETLLASVDVSDRDEVRAMVERTVETFGRIDVLVCNAGVNVSPRDLEHLDPSDWDRMIATNLTGAFNLVHFVLPEMRRRKDGLIIQVASIAGTRASRLAGAGYSASKYGQAALGLGIGLEEGEHGVRSTVIYPGEVNTPILEARPQPVPDERKKQILQPLDVAEAVRFLVELDPRARVPQLVMTPTVDPWS